MKTKTIELYEFEELPADVREKVLDNNRHINVEDSWRDDCVIDKWKEKLEGMGFESPEIHYSGFCSQGDGASFTCKSIDIPRLIKANKDSKRFAAILRNHAKGNLYLAGWIKSGYGSNMYSHENTVYGDSEWEWYGSDKYNPALDKNSQTELSKTLDELSDYITAVARPLMKQIYRDLEKEYEYCTADEAVKDTILANEYTFTITGKMENV